MSFGASSLPKVMVVEDNPVDIDLIEESFEENKINVELITAGNGIQALQILREMRQPDIILLDLNMPKMDGREFLKVVKKHPEFKRIPVVVLTTSDAFQDIESSYELQASAYLTKPVDYRKFVEMMNSFDGFFLKFVKFPSR